MKRLIALFILFCLATVFLASCGLNSTKKPNPASDFEYKVDGEQVTITKYIGKDKTVRIPETIDGKIVTTIGDQAFTMSIITECVLPATIRKIGWCAFAACSNLEKITLNEGLLTIDHGAFAGESKLTEISIPKTVVNIDEQAFASSLGVYASSTLKKVIFEGDAPQNFLAPAPTYYDGNFTIYYHQNAKGFTFPRWNGYPTRVIETENDVPVFENFEYSENETGGITVLAYLGSAENVIIPQTIQGKNVTEIGAYAFKKNSTMRTVTIPNTVISIQTYAFFSCSALTTVALSNGLTEIGAFAFASCRELSTINLPNTLQTLGDYTFHYCTALKSITIPNSITDWGECAFAYTALKSVVFEDGLTTIGNSAFWASELEHITLPDSIKVIDADAFSSCHSLKTITLNEGLTILEAGAFENSGLTAITLPSTVISISEKSFASCRNLISVTLNNGLQSIGDYAFENSDALTEIIIPASVTNINESAFKSCTAMQAVKFEGDAPTAYANPAADVMYGPGYGVYYKVYFHRGAQGFTEGEDWHRYGTEIW